MIYFIDFFFLFTASATTIEKKRMSRRQRKNVKKREKESENLSTTTTNNSSNCSGGTGNGNSQEGTKNQKKRSSQKNPSKFYVSLGLNDDQIYYHLLNYILDQDTLRSIGSYFDFEIYLLNLVDFSYYYHINMCVKIIRI